MATVEDQPTMLKRLRDRWIAANRAFVRQPYHRVAGPRAGRTPEYEELQASQRAYEACPGNDITRRREGSMPRDRRRAAASEEE